MNIGDTIKKYRLSSNMTLDEVAQRIGVSRQTMSRYETGVIANIPSDKIEAIANVFDISPAILMGWSVSWESDVYEDYYSAKSDNARLAILQKNGVPSDLSAEAHRLFGYNNSSATPDLNCVNGDPALTAYLQELRTRPEMRMLFSVAKDATKEDVERAVAVIEALRKTEGK